MTNPATEEKLRKLVPIDRRRAEASWLYYLSGEGEERRAADDLIDILLFRGADKDYRRRNVIKNAAMPTLEYGYRTR